MTRRRSNMFGLILVVVSVILLSLNLLDRAWLEAVACAALVAIGVSVVVAPLGRYTKPLTVCMIGLSLLGWTGHDVSYSRIAGWGLVAISPLLVLLDHLCRRRGTPLFPDRTEN